MSNSHMTTNDRFLTKSRYVLGLECPTKLFYTAKRDVYPDKKFEDGFLQQLANGGFQVGELAKCYFPDGVEVAEKGYEESVARTNELLELDCVTIFEAAIRYGNLFVRVDILRKVGDRVDLIEVKAKSWPPSTSPGLFGARGGLNKDFESKIADLAFQRHVLSMSFPRWVITPYFLFADKTSRCPTDGLNQKFRIQKVNGRRSCVRVGELNAADREPWILTLVPAIDACDVLSTELDPYEGTRTFTEHIDFLSEAYDQDEKIAPIVSSACAKCEFTMKAEELENGKRSGKHECWFESFGWSPEQVDQPNVLNIWDFRKKDAMITAGKISLNDLNELDIDVKDSDGKGISRTQRQWLQITKVCRGETDHWIDEDGLRREMARWEFPLHFIDFETSMPAIPFKQGRRPYEGIAFQFSHHVVQRNGDVVHEGDFLMTDPGTFPNYDFVRSLRDHLMRDKGSIFRYATHENTYLNHIWEQLLVDESVTDRDELMGFIEEISQSKKDQVKKWCGPRNMIDMLDLVKRYYYHPSTGGSNSIKNVLPAILSSSDYLREKYSKLIVTKNFPQGIVWFQTDSLGKVKDPYKLLESLFSDASEKDLDLLLMEEEDRGGIREGGAAMAAYMILQFEEMTDYERRSIERSLRQYCELDTLAMVMIYEAWREFTGT
ncbi:MAG: DUF2779 domain-containing protein [Pyrinomonadaceae bacterium]